MEIYRTQRNRDAARYLVLTDHDLKTGAPSFVVVDVAAKTVRRVKNVSTLLRSETWQMPSKNDLTLDALVKQVPALRPYRGIELRLRSGVSAWIRWRQWSSADADTQRQLTETTEQITVPSYEPDGDYFLAVQAAEALGGAVLDAPRSVLNLGKEAY